MYLFGFSPVCFGNVSLKQLYERMQSHTGCICLTFLHCAFSNVSSNCLPEKRQSHIGCIRLTFSTVRFKMSLQIACLRRGKVTLVAFVWLFSTVRFQMSPQIACLGAGKVTLIALVWPHIGICHLSFYILIVTQAIIFKIWETCGEVKGMVTRLQHYWCTLDTISFTFRNRNNDRI